MPVLQRAHRRRPASNSMRTGMRCTTLTQLPVAFCAGISENSEPVAAPMLVDRAVELGAREGIDLDRRRLADADVGELGFLEVGLDPGAAGLDQRGDGGARRDELADIEARRRWRRCRRPAPRPWSCSRLRCGRVRPQPSAASTAGCLSVSMLGSPPRAAAALRHLLLGRDRRRSAPAAATASTSSSVESELTPCCTSAFLRSNAACRISQRRLRRLELRPAPCRSRP